MKTSESLTSPVHGGQLNGAAKTYNISVDKWIDLSTGINPNGWPIPEIPAFVYQRLPEENDDLISAARLYYGAESVMAIAGSQAAIQMLPGLRPYSRVGVVYPGYQEHAHCWRNVGHQVQLLSPEDIEAHLDVIDVLVIINPNNPTGMIFSKEQLEQWHSRLAERNGWLVVDEAFMDCEPENSLIPLSPKNGLIILRSIGKFFGLAGLRVGFIFAEQSLLDNLAQRLGPWSISNPSRYITAHALMDSSWHVKTGIELKSKSRRLFNLMSESGLSPYGGTHLFQSVNHPYAVELHEQLAKRGVLVRIFQQSSSLRFGLPKDEDAWDRLKISLNKAMLKLDGINLK